MKHDGIRLYYLSNERFPARIACTIQQVLMCEAFARAGAQVTLIVPRYSDMPSADRDEICRFYDVEPLFAVKQVFSLMSLSKPSMDGRRRLRIPWIGGFSLYHSMKREAERLLKVTGETVIYSRSLLGTKAFLDARKPGTFPYKVVFEIHSVGEQKPLRRFLSTCRKADGLIVISRALQTELQNRLALDSQKIFLAPSAIRTRHLSLRIDRREARRRLGLSEAPTVLYAGQLFPGKGVERLLEAAALMPEPVRVVIVGGHGAYLERLRDKVHSKNLSSVTLTGFVPPAQVPIYLAAADVLVLPTEQNYVGGAYTSPLKLYEYMASGRPIVSADLPVLKEVLRDGDNALLFQNENAADLAAAVSRLLDSPSLRERIARRAQVDVHEHTWDKRAEKILQFIDTL